MPPFAAGSLRWLSPRGSLRWLSPFVSPLRDSVLGWRDAAGPGELLIPPEASASGAAAGLRWLTPLASELGGPLVTPPGDEVLGRVRVEARRCWRNSASDAGLPTSGGASWSGLGIGIGLGLG